jgi:hypothetical protein
MIPFGEVLQHITMDENASPDVPNLDLVVCDEAIKCSEANAYKRSRFIS